MANDHGTPTEVATLELKLSVQGNFKVFGIAAEDIGVEVTRVLVKSAMFTKSSFLVY